MTDTATQKKKIGRPQKKIEDVFPENWKELIIEWSSQGWSEAEIRVGLCKIKGKFYEGLWYALQAREPEFSQAIKMCKTIRQAWWEGQARENIKATSFQTGLWYACMKNMFGYKDKQEEPADENLRDALIQFHDIPAKELPETSKRFILN